MLKQAACAVVGLSLVAAAPSWSATSLANLKGRSRVLVISAPSATDPALAQQNQLLEGGEPGLQDRDMVVIRIVGATVVFPGGPTLSAPSLRQALRLPPAKFGVALVGKDGSEVFARSAPITLPTLFGAIDAMPMRREEVRERTR